MVAPTGDIGGSPRIHGLIGQDVLAPRTYTIDYRRRRIFWNLDVSRSDPGATRLPLTLAGGRALVTLPQISRRGGSVQFVPDSGADGLVLFARRDQPSVDVTPLDIAGIRSLAGERLVRRVLVDALDVGDVRLNDQVALLVDGADAGGLLGDGLLPLHLFARVTFNGPAGYLVVAGR
jgi:hypothetical protein